jgi:hypothetical protein
MEQEVGQGIISAFTSNEHGKNKKRKKPVRIAGIPNCKHNTSHLHAHYHYYNHNRYSFRVHEQGLTADSQYIIQS